MDSNKTGSKPEDEKVPENFDEVLDGIGLGMWHFQLVFGVCVVVAQAGPVVVGSTFQDAPLNFRCAHGTTYENAGSDSLAYTGHLNETDFDNSCFIGSLPISIELNDSLHAAPLRQEDSKFVPPLRIFEEKDSDYIEEILCKSFEYDTSLFESTFMSEYNLVCDRAHLKPLFQMLLTVGYAIGNIVGGVLGDS